MATTSALAACSAGAAVHRTAWSIAARKTAATKPAAVTTCPHLRAAKERPPARRFRLVARRPHRPLRLLLLRPSCRPAYRQRFPQQCRHRFQPCRRPACRRRSQRFPRHRPRPRRLWVERRSGNFGDVVMQGPVALNATGPCDVTVMESGGMLRNGKLPGSGRTSSGLSTMNC